LIYNGAGSYGGNSFYPYSVLTGGELPDNVDPSRKEDFLTEQEFVQVLGMDRDTWAQLPAWKRTAAKRETHLF